MVGADEMYANTQHTFHNDVLHVSYLKLLDIAKVSSYGGKYAVF
jgi:hypothetical protein